MKKEKYAEPNILLPWTFLVFVAITIPIWSIPHTMAVRNISLGVSLLLLSLSCFDWQIYKKQLNIFYFLILYLIINFLFISTNFEIAFKNFRSEWLKFILYYILGLGTALALIKCRLNKTLLWIGLLFSVPIFIHILLIINKTNFLSFPWGYLGINTMHGELAYTSLAATIFLSVYLNFQASKVWEYILVLTSLIACIFSLVIAQSRGGIIFNILSMFIITIYNIYKQSHSSNKNYGHWFGALTLILIITLTAFFHINSDLSKWQNMVGKIKTGMIASKDSYAIACNGVDALSIQLIKDQPLDLEKKAQIISVVDGDGARVIGLVTGLKLIIKNPMGLDQSRQAYQIALKKYCNDQPFAPLSHAHNGWINTALAVGIIGALLLFGLFLQMLKNAYQGMGKDSNINPFSTALFFSSLIWMLRAMVDSTMQDQSLEMQAFILSLLFGLALQERANMVTYRVHARSR